MYQYDSNGNKIRMDNKQPPREQYVSPPEKKKTSNIWIWVVVTAVVVIILAGVFLWLRRSQGSSTVSMGMKRPNLHRWGFRFY